ncbi:MAG: AMP-binding protein [Candidatus Bathyarchaeota archaeon]
MIAFNSGTNDAYWDSDWRIPKTYNIAEEICHKHATRKEKVALFYEDEEGNKEECSFYEIKSLSDKFAHVLCGLGLKRGDRVAIMLPQRPENVISHLGVLKMGAVSVPLSTLYGKDTLNHCLRNCRPKAIVIETKERRRISRISKKLKELVNVIVVGEEYKDELGFKREVRQAARGFRGVSTKANDAAMIFYTSGTTGLPRGVLHAHRFLIGRLPGFQLAHDLFPQEGDLFWSPADWVWVGGLVDCLFAPWVYGVPVVAYPRKKFDPNQSLSLLEEYDVRNSFIPPTALTMMMKEVENVAGKYNINLRSLHSGGEHLPAATLKWAEKELGVSINEIYGLTEANFLIGNCNSSEVKPGSMGKPYPGHKIEVLDEGGEILPSGKIGEIAVFREDPVMFLEYWDNPEATRKSFSGHWFLTGDLAYKDGEGYFWFVGRKDDVIISSGHRIGPIEVESSIIRHSAVEEVAVVACPDEIRGNIVKAFVKLKADYRPSLIIRKEIQKLVKEDIALYAYPREIEFIDEIPKSVTGKIKRDKLRERH